MIISLNAQYLEETRKQEYYATPASFPLKAESLGSENLSVYDEEFHPNHTLESPNKVSDDEGHTQMNGLNNFRIKRRFNY